MPLPDDHPAGERPGQPTGPDAPAGPTDATPARALEILDFWFGPDLGAVPADRQRRWFVKDPAFDAELRARFLADMESAAAGRLGGWQATPAGALVLTVLLDQFPRNVFRGTARAFAADPLARAVAGQAIAEGFDARLPPLARVFFYLPFEHSEDLADQERSVALAETLAAYPECDSARDYAHRHHAVIVRFGRFPHRNAALGRADTPEEAEYLRQPGAGF